MSKLTPHQVKEFYQLPEKVVFCKKCVVSNQRPNSVVEFKNSNNQKEGIKFNNQICEACNYNNIKNEINWSEREQELIKLFKLLFTKLNGFLLHLILRELVTLLNEIIENVRPRSLTLI